MEIKSRDHPLPPQTILNSVEQKCVKMSPFLGATSLGGVERMDGNPIRVQCNSDFEADFSQCLKFFLLPL